jgi:N-acetyl-anhydromuramyl-L-alanine amidase AmpD
MKKALIYISIIITLNSCTTEKIIDKPILFDEVRKELTLAYLKEHYGLDQQEPTINPKMVIVHWTAFSTLDESYEAFKEPKLSSSRPDIVNASVLNVSSQFMVDRDGTIYRLMPENFMARHVIGLNHCAIGIENVGGTSEFPLTAAQLKSNIWLVRYLKEKYDIQYLIGHYEYTNFEDHKLWLEKDNGYRTTKTDPGIDFISDIRMAITDLDLEENPATKEMESDSLIHKTL